ncbi:hypothetical protein UY3_17319 [Chelonia mydas]|uniref:Uncharacterized protein n=1 Tax=Chelonia mydas TaxID=8469 RepID=M7AM91_CHEMY|nr:hypothetical protein UY3_17319 [Chelonia mydas]
MAQRGAGAGRQPALSPVRTAATPEPLEIGKTAKKVSFSAPHGFDCFQLSVRFPSSLRRVHLMFSGLHSFSKDICSYE